jgi:tRNA (guanine37-N1)-methyltransferase
MEEGSVPLFAILTLFPESLAPYAEASILGLARARGQIDLQFIDFRDFSRDRHRTVDDRPFGGGPGMLLKPEPIADCVEWLEARHGRFRKFALCPGGRPFKQSLAEELARDLSCGDPEKERVLLLCGRYEGFDDRLCEELALEPLSIGDYVLSGGELPALVVVEAVTRLLPGVLGDERSSGEDSFTDPDLLDCPHYTRPRVWRGREVPDVLLSGDHKRITEWRSQQATRRTRTQRPDLAGGAPPRSTCAAPTGAAPEPIHNEPHEDDEPRGSHQPCT